MKVPNLAALRARAGLSQSQLSELSGVSKDTISKLESGERPKAQAVTTAKLADGLGVRSEVLSGESVFPRDDSRNGRCASAVEKRMELFEIGKDLDEIGVELLLDLARELSLASTARQIASADPSSHPQPQPETEDANTSKERAL